MSSIELLVDALASEHLIAAGTVPSQDQASVLLSAANVPTRKRRKRLSRRVANAEAGPSKRAKTQVVSTSQHLLFLH